MTMRARAATPADAAAIARIYNHGIDDRVATFETRHRTADDVARWRVSNVATRSSMPWL